MAAGIRNRDERLRPNVIWTPEKSPSAFRSFRAFVMRMSPYCVVQIIRFILRKAQERQIAAANAQELKSKSEAPNARLLNIKISLLHIVNDAVARLRKRLLFAMRAGRVSFAPPSAIRRLPSVSHCIVHQR